MRRRGADGAELEGALLDDAGSPHGYAWQLLLRMHGVRGHRRRANPASSASCSSGSAKGAVTGALMLHKAVAAMKKADVKGMDILEPGVLLAPQCQAAHAHGGNSALDVSVCDPQHEQYDSTHCRTRFSGAYACATQPE